MCQTDSSQTSPRLEAVVQIAEALGVQPATLLRKLPSPERRLVSGMGSNRR